MTRYWAMILIMLFNLVWAIVSITTSIDLTLVGHLRGWKRIPCAKWLGGFIDKKRKSYPILADCATHPQVVAMLLGCLAMLCGFIALTVSVWFVVNDIELPLLWMIVALLYVFAGLWLLFWKTKTQREYRHYLNQKSPSE